MTRKKTASPPQVTPLEESQRLVTSVEEHRQYAEQQFLQAAEYSLLGLARAHEELKAKLHRYKNPQERISVAPADDDPTNLAGFIIKTILWMC